MEVKELNKKLRAFAIGCGLCQQWQQDWQEDWDEGKMIDRFYSGIDFYLKQRFIPKEFFKQSLDRDFLRENGIIVDDKYSLLNPERAIVIGSSDATIRVNGLKPSTIYAVDGCHLKVVAKNRSFVIVHALDNAMIDAHAYDHAHLVVILHSHDAKMSGNAKIKEEYDYLK